ncbi:MAG: hypothetical protein KJ767_03570 [Nanoarchaeota archaeon]|nr:hypothetical protein [Nanoarchaeota archaeon]
MKSKRRTGKRAQVRQEVVLWVIALIVLVVLSIFVYFLYYNSPATINKETCKQSVLMRAAWIMTPSEVRPPLRCKTQDVEIKTTNQDEIKREIANSMYDCWDMLGQGKVDFLGQDATKWFAIQPDEPACIICSRITFADNVKTKVKNVNNLTTYLNNVKIPGKEITYSQFLMDDENAKLEILDPSTPSSLTTNRQYAVVFMNMRGTDPLTIAKKAAGFGGVSGVGIGLLVAKVASKLAGPVGIGIGVAYAATATTTGIMTMRTAGKNCDGNMGGCNALILTPYEAEELNNVCKDLKSIP